MSAERPDHAREIKFALADPGELLTSLGFLAVRGAYQRQARGFIVRCPVHEETTPSCSVQCVNGLVMWKCHGCGESGDALSLIAAVRGMSIRSDFRSVLIEAAAIAGLHEVVRELETRTENADRPVFQPPMRDPIAEVDYPPQAQVDDLWSRAMPVTEDAEVTTWLASRGVDANRVELSDLARALPADATLPRWASWRGPMPRSRSWIELGHRVLFPMRDPTGAIRSVRAGRMGEGESPKRLPPSGCRASGLVMADEMATAMLVGSRIPKRVVITEGEPDFLAMATSRQVEVTGVIGIVSGSWTPEFALRFPEGCGIEVIIWTDRDAAGDRYAAEIAPWLVQRGCFVRRDGRDA